MMNERKLVKDVTRREFLVTSTLSASALAAGMTRAGAQATGEVKGSDRIKIGLIGCGGRGTSTTKNSLTAADGVEVVAMADLFPDRLASSLKSLQTSKGGEGRIHVPQDRQFTGFDAYKHLLGCDDVNYVILATPPAWRPTHLAAAVDAARTSSPRSLSPWIPPASAGSWKPLTGRRRRGWPSARARNAGTRKATWRRSSACTTAPSATSWAEPATGTRAGSGCASASPA